MTARSLAALFILAAVLGAASLAGQAPAGKPALALQIGHVDDIGSLAFSPDGAQIVTVSRDRTAKLWNARDLSLIQTLEGHAGGVLAAAYTADGKRLFTLDAAGKVRAWSPSNGSLLATQDTAAGPMTAGALFAGPERLLIAGAEEGKNVGLWKAAPALDQNPEAIARLNGHQKPVHAAAFSRDGKALATGDDEGAVKTWDTSDGSLQRNMKSHAMPIHGLAFSPDGTQLLDGSFDGYAFLLDLKTGRRAQMLQMNRPEEGVASVAWAPDGAQVALAGAGGRDRSESIRLWDPRAPKETRILASPSGYVTAVAFSADSRWVASAGRDDVLRIWDAQSGKEMAAGGVLDTVRTVATAPDGSLLASGSADGALRLWDLRAGTLLGSFPAHPGGVNSVAFSKDGSVLATAGADGLVKLWNPRTSKELREMAAKQGPAQCVAFAPDGKSLAAGYGETQSDGALVLWETESGKSAYTKSGSMAAVRSIGFSGDGEEITTGTGVYGGEVRFWKAASGQVVGHDFFRVVRAVAYSPDGKRVATASSKFPMEGKSAADEIRVWNAQTHAEQQVLTLPGEGSGVYSLTFLPDNVSLAAGYRDGSIRLWNVRTGEQVRTLEGHQAGVLNLSAGPGLLASAGRDNSIRLWDAQQGRLKATLLPLPAGRRGQDPGEWLTVTPDGYYAGSPGAGRFIRWRVGGDLFPVEAYEDKFRSPEKVRSLLGGEAAAPPMDLKGLIPPDIRFTSPNDGSAVDGATIKVNLTATDDKKVDHVQLLVNGRAVSAKPLFLGAKPLLLGVKGVEGPVVPSAHRNESTYEIEVALPPGEKSVSLRAVAYDEDGLTGWDQVEVRPKNPDGALGDLHVISVGVTQYRNPAFNLKYAAKDAEAFSGLWKGSEGKLYGHIITHQLLDDQATAANVRKALEEVRDKASRLDSIVLFLSGHGLRIKFGEFYFATHEIDTETVQKVEASALPWTDVERLLSETKARRVAVFLDACHSGGAMGDRQADNESLAELVVKRSGALVFASSRGSQQSYELDALQHGAFSGALIEAIQQGKADLAVGGAPDGRIDVEELLTYLRARVPRMTENQQTPSCPLMTDFGEPFPLAAAP